MRERLDLVRQRTHARIALPAAIIYLGLIAGVYLYMYDGQIANFYRSLPLPYTIATSVSAILAAALFGILASLIVTATRELHTLGLGTAGILFGGLAAGCPGCAFGLFPLFLGLFGIGGTLAILPLRGVELQLLSILLLAGAIMLAARPQGTCARRKRQ